MAITYPLSLPTSGIRSIRMVARNSVAISQSPFSLSSQIYKFPGQTWEADVSLPAMNRATAEEWIAFLLKLNGQYGTFTMGDPSGATARGSASSSAGSPTVSSGTAGSQSLSITGAAANASTYLLPGDYLQLGSGSSSRLHKVLNTVSTDGSGAATIDIWPAIRSTASGAVVVSNPKGIFRLNTSDSSWDIDEAITYGIVFGAAEAL